MSNLKHERLSVAVCGMVLLRPMTKLEWMLPSAMRVVRVGEIAAPRVHRWGRNTVHAFFLWLRGRVGARLQRNKFIRQEWSECRRDYSRRVVEACVVEK